MIGFEPTHPKALPPEDSVSTNFTTCALSTPYKVHSIRNGIRQRLILQSIACLSYAIANILIAEIKSHFLLESLCCEIPCLVLNNFDFPFKKYIKQVICTRINHQITSYVEIYPFMPIIFFHLHLWHIPKNR